MEKIFNEAWFLTICFDIFWHWKSEWKIEDLTLSICLKQLEEMKNIFLKVPFFDYREKRERELWAEKMKDWEEKWIIEIIPSENWKPLIFSKYNFLQDFDKNFQGFLSKNTKNIFVWAWIKDEEVLIDDLREKVKENKILLK